MNLDHIHLDLTARIKEKQFGQKQAKGIQTPAWSFKEQDKFMPVTSNMVTTVINVLESSSFMIKLDQGKTVYRHVDHIRTQLTKTTDVQADTLYLYHLSLKELYNNEAKLLLH